jgi:uncharacterized protein (TIGR02444 family)
MRFWDWALEVYARPKVAEACLTLQDGHGQNPPYLLWAAWRAAEGREADARAAVDIVRRWDAEIGSPLRGVRRTLKAPMAGIADVPRQDFREAVKGLELQGERVLMESLEAISGQAGPPRDLLEGLREAAQATGDPPRDSALKQLADALS